MSHSLFFAELDNDALRALRDQLAELSLCVSTFLLSGRDGSAAFPPSRVGEINRLAENLGETLTDFFNPPEGPSLPVVDAASLTHLSLNTKGFIHAGSLT